ncbi:MAG: preprotein translocase subunit SecY [Candidatus Diapherotrites archaeon]|nr:preprotein translocase subunit SecY [Candidatus Diapherotrites archaeon]
MGILDALEPVYSILPEVKPPEVAPSLKKRLMWSAAVLILFFILGRIWLVGMPKADLSQYNQLIAFQELLASETGSLLTAGIGPIVFASIILQLLVGAKIIDIDLTDPKGKSRFQGMQKLFTVGMCLFEGIIYPWSGMVPSSGFANVIFLGLQIALGSMMLLYLDEVVGKYGVGSGIGLFIAGGVTQGFIWQIFRPPMLEGGALQPGLIFLFFESWSLVLLLPILIAILIFAIIVYADAIHVNIPITMGRKGFGGRYPVSLLYVNVMPVILAVALFANIRVWGALTSSVPVLGDIMRYLIWATGNPVSTAGWALYNTSIYNLFNKLIEQVGASGFGILFTQSLEWNILQGIVYLLLLCGTCVVFGKFWVKMGGQSSEDIANQLESSGMYVPGFRRDSRIIEKILDRYIPPIVVIGSIFVGLLAGIGNMALGSATGGQVASGTGILLTVGIVYKLYEQIAREQVKESSALLKKLFG